MHRIHFLDTKNITGSFHLLGKQSTGHAHRFFHVLIAQGFLGSFGDFLFDDLLGFSFDATCQACCQSTQGVTREFQGITGPFKALETSTHYIHQYTFPILIIILVRTKSRQTTPSHVFFFFFFLTRHQ